MRYLAIALLLFACGADDDDDDTRADAALDCAQLGQGETYSPGMEHTGDEGLTVRLMTSVPAPPQRFDNLWTIQVLDADQAPRDDAVIGVEPFMPDHGHGTPVEVVVTPTGVDGTYDLDPVNLWMPGLWEVRVDATVDATSDRIVFSFCIDE